MTIDLAARIGRRNMLRAGVLGATGLSLSGLLKLEADEATAPVAKTRSVIFTHLLGGPSHLDTFDMKPNAPDGIRGEFQPIATAIPGHMISEHLPALAGSADRYSLLRGVSHNLAAHDLGQKYILTGNRPQAGIEYPAIGAVASKELDVPRELPPYVAIPRVNVGPGHLGVAFGPFDTYNIPKIQQPSIVRGIDAGSANNIAHRDRRFELLKSLDRRFGNRASEDQLIAGLDRFSQKAFDILQSSKTREAFDIGREPTEIRERFGDSGLGQSCLLATRLVEAGVRFVSIADNGWDTHADNFTRLRTRQLPGLDRGVAGLLLTLSERGLLDETTVVVSGEFGRTPKINPNAGRDHWPRAMFMLLAGGAIAPARLIGSSDAEGMGPSDTTIPPADVAATLVHALGIDPTMEYTTSTGRPVMIVREGTPIRDLLA